MIDGDLIEIVIDCRKLVGSINLVGVDGKIVGAHEGDRLLKQRRPRADLAPDPALPTDTRLWAVLQAASGGTWGGCVYDADAITQLLGAKVGVTPLGL